MNKLFKSGIALLLAGLMLFSATSCAGHKKTTLDLEKFPLVFADSKGLEAVNEGDSEPTLITSNFYTFLNSDKKVQAASDGRIYYIETKNKKTTLGDLFAYDVVSKETELIHSGVYSFKVSHDASCIIISDGTGGIFKYDKKHEKKDNYTFIQKSGVSSVLDISADGKYVLYSQVLKATNYYTLTLAKTDFQTTDELDNMTVKERKQNKSVAKGPVIIAENYKQLLGVSDDLSSIYYEKAGEETTDPAKLYAFTNYKQSVLLSETKHETCFVNAKGEICYYEIEGSAKKTADIVTDKYAQKDAKLKKKNASQKAWEAKQKRDATREKIGQYLSNINAYSFYRFSATDKQPKMYLELFGQLSAKGVDSDNELAFFSANTYDFAAAKKPNINSISVVYQLFEDIRTRAFIAVNSKAFEALEIEGCAYNSADVYADTANKSINIIMDFDYLKTKVGKLYRVAYDEEGFGDAKFVSSKAAKVAHFDAKDGVYFVSPSGNLVLDTIKNIVLENYAYCLGNGQARVAFTSVGTGKKDDYGNEITDDTAYFIQGKKAVKLGKMFINKEVIVKGNMLAFYTDYDYKEGSGNMVLFNGEKVVHFNEKVSMVYKFA